MPAKKATPVAKTTGRKATAAPVAVAPPVRARKATAKETAKIVTFPTPPAPHAANGFTLGTKRTSEEFFSLTVPSGETCQVRRPGIQGLIKAGILDSMDSLTASVQTEHIDRTDTGARKAADARAVVSFAKDTAQIVKGLDLIDVLCCYVVVRPQLYRPEDYAEGGPLVGKEPPDGAVSVKDVDIIDRMFILQWAVGGVTDLSGFHKEFGSVLDDISSLQNISL